MSINTFVEGGCKCNQRTLHRTGYIEIDKLHISLLVNSGWLYFSNFKVFIEFFADEYGLNGGLDFLAEVCEAFFDYISRDLIFKWYDNSDGGCSRVG